MDWGENDKIIMPAPTSNPSWGANDKIITPAPSNPTWGADDKTLDQAAADWRAQHAADVPLPPSLALPAAPSNPQSLDNKITNLSTAFGGGITAGLADTAKIVPLIAGGVLGAAADNWGAKDKAITTPFDDSISGALRNASDKSFAAVSALGQQAAQNNAEASDISRPAAAAGNVASILPLLLGGEAALPERLASLGDSSLLQTVGANAARALPVAGALATTQAANTATNAVDQGADAGTADNLYGVSLGANTLANLIPGGAGGNLLMRALTGGAAGLAGGYGSQAAEHAAAPQYVAAPDLQSTLTSGGIGALLGAVLGIRPNAPDAVTTDGTRLAPDEQAALPPPTPPAGNLPPGADYTARAEPLRPANTPQPTMAVGPDGTAYTPVQGAQTLADAILGGSAPAPGLPQPVVSGDSAGNAIDSAAYMRALQDSQATQDAALAQAREKADLGLTPDVERAQAARWVEQTSADPDAVAAYQSIGVKAAELPEADSIDSLVHSALDAGADPRDIATAASSGTMDERSDRLMALSADAMVGKALDAGVTPEAIQAATSSGSTAQRVQQLAALTQVSETAHGTDTQAIQRYRGPGDSQAFPAPAANDGAPSESSEGSRRANTQRGGTALERPAGEQAAVEPAIRIPEQQGISQENGQTSTPAFKSWFNESKVTDNEGKPLTVYHGTGSDFHVFDHGQSDWDTGHASAPLGHFFTGDKGLAERYAENASEGRPADERVVDAHLSIQHPAEWTTEDLQRIDSPADARAERARLESQGHDGIHIADTNQWIAFHPEQIKSASENRGTFDPNNPDIRYSVPRAVSYVHDVRARLASGDSRGGMINMGRTPAVLRMLGFPDAPLHMPPSVLFKIASGKNGQRPPLTQRQIEKLPELLDEPKSVFDSSTEKGALVIVTSEKDANGNPIVVSVSPDHPGHGNPSLRINVLTSAYGKNDPNWFQREADQNRLRFDGSEKQQTPDDRVSSGAALNLRAEPDNPGFALRKVMRPDDLRKYREDQRNASLSGKSPSSIPSDGVNIDPRRTPEQVRQVLAKSPLGKSLSALEKKGILRIESRPELTESGWWDGEKAVLNAARIGSGEELAVAMHELGGHAGLKDMVGEQGWRRIVDDLLQIASEPGAAGDVVRRAVDRMEAAGTPPHQHEDEFVAYTVEEAIREGNAWKSGSRLNSALVRLFQRIRAWFKTSRIGKWLAAHGVDMKLNPDDIASLAAAAVKHVEVKAERGDAIRTDTGGEPLFSRKPADGDFDDLSDMPSRRPGESQQDYMRRVMRKNKDEVREALQVAKGQRAIGRLQMRAMWAKQDRQTAIADHVFNGYRKIFDKEDPRINLRTIDQWENGEKIWDPDARQFFDTMKDAFDQRIAAIQKLAPDAMQELISNYFPHIWEDSSKALKWYQGNMAKRPLEGNKAFLKQRTWGTIKEGMASGLKPVSTNPVDLAMLKLGQMDKFIAFNEFRQDLQQRGWLKRMEAGERTPAGYARVEDPAFQIAGGLQGYYAVPELIAKDINNYLSPSLYRFGAWKALRTVQNVLMSSRLGLSMFHGGFTTMDNLVMHADVAGRRMMLGDLAGGLQTLAKAPLSVVWSPIEGGQLNKQWLGLKPSDANTAAVLDMLEQGGAHMKMSPTEDNSGITKLIRAVRQKSVAGSAKQVLPAIGESISWIIHHKLVPNQKMAARVMLAKFELDRVAGSLGKEKGDYAGITQAMHPDALKQIAAHVVDLVDDRLGQMNYDNQFWNKTAREAAQAAIGAVGWQVGTLRTVTGGARDLQRLWNPEKLLSSLDKEGAVQGDMGRVTGRLSYLVTLALLMGGLSAATQYLLTGKGPQEAEDYFFPKTGNKNDDGSDERLQWPSYWSDHYKLATHPIETAIHKINPSFGMLMEALSNRDYFGTEIRNPDDPWYKQAGEVGAYLAKGFVPYSLTGAEKVSGTTASPARQAANFLGITKAPASVSRTRFQEFVAEKAYSKAPQSAHTEYSQERREMMHQAEAAMRRGDPNALAGIDPMDIRKVVRASRQQVPEAHFKELSILDKLRAYDLATPQEREEYGLAPIIFRSNWRQSIRELPEAEQQNVINKLESIDSDYRSAKP